MREHVDLPTVQALQAEWQRHPPVHHLVATYLGYQPPPLSRNARTGSATGTVVNVEDFLAEIGDVHIPVRVGRPPDSTDFDAFMASKNLVIH